MYVCVSVCLQIFHILNIFPYVKNATRWNKSRWNKSAGKMQFKLTSRITRRPQPDADDLYIISILSTKLINYTIE